MITQQPLAYSKNALEPIISAQTVEFHYDKHHAGYVSKYNTLVKDTKYDQMGLEEILSNISAVEDEIRVKLRNLGGQIYNHDLYWQSLSPDKTEMSPELMAQVETDFGSVQELKTQLMEAAIGQFGSGWAWLTWDGQKLFVEQTLNAYNPVMDKNTPLLTIDVWEHAYYLDYQNKRAEYVEKLWSILNWQNASKNFSQV